MIETKRCNKCGETKPLSDYHRDSTKRDGRCTFCKSCRWTPVAREVLPEGTKRCNKCGEVKALSEFYLRGRGGYVHRCKTCNSQANRDRSFTPAPARIGGLTIVKDCGDFYGHSPSNCGRLLPVTEFHRCKTNPDGLSSSCKDCKARIQREFGQTEQGREVNRQANRRRRARLAELPSEPYTVAQIIERDGPECWMCGVVPTGNDQTVEHFIAAATESGALVWWGIENPGDVLANVAIACRSCNARKLNRIMPCAVAKYLRNLAAETVPTASVAAA